MSSAYLSSLFPVLDSKRALINLFSLPPRSGVPPIRILQQLQAKHPELMKSTKTQIFLDGGVNRGTDVLKVRSRLYVSPLLDLSLTSSPSFRYSQALCLGATAVGLGRPFLYAQSGWGTQGVVKAVKSEFKGL